ncbi:hypothetical protein [Desulfosporosinus fructosivorans]
MDNRTHYHLGYNLFIVGDSSEGKKEFSVAIHLKKAIIRNRWKLKSRRDLKVLTHFQARAGERAPTRNSPAVHDDIFIIQCCPFMHKQGACAVGEASVMGCLAGSRLCGFTQQDISLFLTQAAERNCSRTG